ncbi:hypothetical protein GCM10007276_21640 [Agaricicola taiwanensis]|uniref:Uncharacterized protein n=1 Tax=Agaricicola taiwanensis TaxID=591372 RepID=A0A8J3DUY2_9RHOB|nr:hypothetical protein GCM10007276_21640 [Agaricicola taiwanensis]
MKEFAGPCFSAKASEAHCRIGEIGRMPEAVHAKANNKPCFLPGTALSLNEDAGELGAIDQDVVGPFDGKPAARGGRDDFDGVGKCERRDKAQKRRSFRRQSFRQKAGCVEIADRRIPRPPPTSPPRLLAVSQDPQRTGLAIAATAKSLGVGRIDRLQNS